jgi:hypothetical protein
MLQRNGDSKSPMLIVFYGIVKIECPKCYLNVKRESKGLETIGLMIWREKRLIVF